MTRTMSKEEVIPFLKSVNKRMLEQVEDKSEVKYYRELGMYIIDNVPADLPKCLDYLIKDYERLKAEAQGRSSIGEIPIEISKIYDEIGLDCRDRENPGVLATEVWENARENNRCVAEAYLNPLTRKFVEVVE